MMKTSSALLFFGLMILAARRPPSSLLWTQAFSVSPSTTHTRSSRGSSTSSSTTGSRLFMSDIPEDNSNKQRKTNNRHPRPSRPEQETPDNDFLLKSWTAFLKPPPKPEDQFVMVGDLFALFVYSITDHLICQTCSQYVLQQAAMDPQKMHTMATNLAESSPQIAALLSTPVWLEDGTNPNSAASLQLLHDQVASQMGVNHYYSPLLEEVGTATCVLAATWLFAGWLNRAFLFRNTLNCPTTQALAVTGRTWMVTVAILSVCTMATSSATGFLDSSASITNLPLTHGDLDFIFGSLSVVALWRFLFSSILGGGK